MTPDDFKKIKENLDTAILLCRVKYGNLPVLDRIKSCWGIGEFWEDLSIRGIEHKILQKIENNPSLLLEGKGRYEQREAT